MKNILFMILVSFSTAAFSQNNNILLPGKDNNRPVTAFEQYVYIDGIRLDSIKSSYAEITREREK